MPLLHNYGVKNGLIRALYSYVSVSVQYPMHLSILPNNLLGHENCFVVEFLLHIP